MLIRLLFVLAFAASGAVGNAVPPLVTRATQSSDHATSPSAASIRGNAALAQIPYPWESKLADWTIEFHDATSGPYGLTYTVENRIEVFVRADQSDEHLAHVIAHELGHAVDLTLNTAQDRDAWLVARSIEGSAWWPSSGKTDFSTGAGDFAESFAQWQAGGSIFRSTLSGPPTPKQVALLASMSFATPDER